MLKLALSSRSEGLRSAQTISTYAGDGTFGYIGDGGPATQGRIHAADGVAVDSQGNLYIAEAGNLLIRRVDAATGFLSTFAGVPTPGYTGDNGPATLATFYYPSDVAVDSRDNVYISDFYNSVIRRVDAPEPPLLPAEQAYFLRENLRLRLLSARLALLSRNATMFADDLRQAQAWLLRYYERDAPATREALAQLKALQDAPLPAEPPTLSETLDAVRAFKARRERASG